MIVPVLRRKVARDLARRRVRSSLTILGICVGVAGLVAVSMTARGLAESQRRLVESQDHPDLTVRTSSLAHGFESVVARSLDGATVEARSIQDLTFSDGGPWQSATLIGLEPGEPPLLARPELVSGTWPGPGEVAFDAGVDAIADIAIGDLVAVRLDVAAEPVYLQVVGFTRTPGALTAGILNRAIAYADPSVVEGVRGRIGPNQLLVKLAPFANPDQAAADLDRLLLRRGVAHSGVERTENEITGSRELQTLVWLMLAFSLLGLGLSGVLVANTAAATVLDETRQVGVLKALGATRAQILSVYLAHSLALGTIGAVLGGAVGVAGGGAIVAYLTDLIGYPRPSAAPSVREAALAAIVGFGLPLLATAVPVAFAVRKSTVLLLGTYGLSSAPTAGRRLGFGVLTGRQALLSLAARGAIRRRLRATLTVTLIAVAVASAIAAHALAASLDGTVSSLYDRYGADLWLTVSPSGSDSLTDALAAEPGVQTAERWARATGHGAGRAIDLWGIPARSSIYDARIVGGRWLQPGEQRSAVASTALARRLTLVVGDQLAVDVRSETIPFTIVGIVDDESTNLGSTSAGKLFVPPNAVTSFRAGGFAVYAIRLHRHDPSSVETAVASIEERFAPLAPTSYATYGDQASTERTVQVVTVLLRAMVALVGATGLVGVLNTLAMNLAERRREIGVLRSLGARRIHLILVVGVEGIVLGMLGFVLGLTIGLPLSWAIVSATGQHLFRLDFRLPPSFLAATFAMTLAACATAAIGPALLAANVRPREVLRYE